MAVADLRKVVAAPKTANQPGSPEAWAAAEAALGIAYPADFKEYVGVYGSGTLGGVITVFNPMAVEWDGAPARPAGPLAALLEMLSPFGAPRERWLYALGTTLAVCEPFGTLVLLGRAEPVAAGRRGPGAAVVGGGSAGALAGGAGGPDGGAAALRPGHERLPGRLGERCACVGVHAIENFNGQFKAIFGCLEKVPTHALVPTRLFVLGVVLFYQLTLWHHALAQRDLRQRLKPFLLSA